MNPCNQCIYQSECSYYDKIFGRELDCDCFIDINMFDIEYKLNKSIWHEMSYRVYTQNFSNIDDMRFNGIEDY